MEKDRKFRNLALITVILSVLGVSIAFAALSQTLTIKGVGTIKGNTWKISFDNLQEPILVGSAALKEDASLTDNSTTMNFSILLYRPGDSVTYLFDVVNGGTIDAKITNISLTGVDDAIAADVTYTLKYADDSDINVGDTLDSTVTKNLKLVVTFNSSATNVPSNDITLNLGATIDYTQK